MNIQLRTQFRPATAHDCSTAARLMQIASDGVCDYIWSLHQDEFPGLSRLEIGAQRYAQTEGDFTYRNSTLAFAEDAKGEMRTQGMMMAYAIPVEKPTESVDELSDENSPGMDVLAPYSLEQPNSWYVCMLAVFPEYRGQGIGTQFLDLAVEQARSHHLPQLSLLCFEQNRGALRLYQREGFRVVDQMAVVPHPLIHHTGDILLMTKSV